MTLVIGFDSLDELRQSDVQSKSDLMPHFATKSLARVDFRMPENLKNEVEQAAAIQGVSLTTFFAEAALERAREVKARHAITVLNDAERYAFLALMSSPPEPNPALARLMSTDVVL